MKKDRVITFLDAMLPIIMTFLVLEFPKPQHLDFSTLFELRTDFFAYAISFFWLGMMWINSHGRFQNKEDVTDSTLWATVVMLFFASLIPWATEVLSLEPNNRFAAGFYGVIIFLVSFSNLWQYATLHQGKEFQIYLKNLSLDLVIKLIGFVIAITVYPMAILIFVFLAGLFLYVISIHQNKKATQ
ncbi:TMEM175 family protein [Convivina praedatoris]|uniref:DUF1211 domain-containing protein n=1 Tax=Convivina praedatoris TaxID=2880963 RepID=A0ABN8HCQ9_9LACO|nr:TMEM175 family protein [Convivina sp. LMG 32447]CAH1851988.1 hypothetical protein LMG032447_00457 [Convivina sp. LMG 32447]CAH1852022.1 hypothetical protein R078138_00467 [Convivina sp. LMG 32447]CAH1852904.1 hypothetical protein R077815_00650 [Convivina sp. LMG 32447]